MPQSKRAHWLRPRFSLWAMLVLITVVAIPLGYVAQRRSWNLRRKAAIEVLLDNGLHLECVKLPTVSKNAFRQTWQWLTLDGESPSVILASDQVGEIPPVRSAKSLSLLGDFPEIESVELTGWNELTDEHLQFLARMPHLSNFSVHNSPMVRGDFLKCFAHCKKLDSLELRNLEAIEAGPLQHLAEVKSLTGLCIRGCPLLTDSSLQCVHLPAGIVHLRLEGHFGDETLMRWLGQRQLEYLRLDCPISGKAVAALEAQRTLTWLDIANAPLEDREFEFLKHCDHLKSLKLRSMPIRGEFLEWISNPTALETLTLSNTLLADAHLPAFARFTNLAEIDLSFTPISGEGFGSLKAHFNGVTFRLWGARLSEAGKEAFAQSICGTAKSRIWLPGNWRAADMALLAHAPKSQRKCIASELASHESDVALLFGDTYAPGEMLEGDRFTQIDRSPPVLMSPVKRLIDAARRDAICLHNKQNGSDTEMSSEADGRAKESTDGE